MSAYRADHGLVQLGPKVYLVGLRRIGERGSMPHILLVEDQLDFQLIVKKTLGSRYQITCAASLKDAFLQIEKTDFDLILLDVELPDGDGFQACARLQKEERTRPIPVIFLTGKKGTSHKVMGFSVGGDDYLEKPFEPLELIARVDVKISKFRQKKESEEVLVKGGLKINASFQKVYLNEAGNEIELALTPIEFKMLYYLVRNEDRIISRDQLLTAVWGPNTFVVDRTVDKHISSLRQKLSSCSTYVQTVSGCGYKFSTSVQKAVA